MTPHTASDDISQRRAKILSKIAVASEKRGEGQPAPELVAVSKKQPDTRIAAMLETGHRVFGENRVQEAQSRWTQRRALFPDLKLHLIGPLQTNKAEAALALFDVVETLDRPKLARAIAKAQDKTGRRPTLFVQVNTGEEPQKAGIAPSELGILLSDAKMLGLNVCGLMCIPPLEEPAGPHFALLAKLAESHGLRALSMGMSSDFETAIGFGATHVRVGSAMFGARPADT